LLEITEETSLDDTDVQRIHDGLSASDPTSLPRNYVPLTVTLRDAESHLVGGLLAATIWEWLVIDALWVDARFRGMGHGHALVRRAEHAAYDRGCRRARLDTFDFQARNFYERLGYVVYARLDGFPTGHEQLHMQKTLTRAS
jgi:GNAT superfamily N-acetyltransferase